MNITLEVTESDLIIFLTIILIAYIQLKPKVTGKQESKGQRHFINKI